MGATVLSIRNSYFISLALCIQQTRSVKWVWMSDLLMGLHAPLGQKAKGREVSMRRKVCLNCFNFKSTLSLGFTLIVRREI